MFHLHVYVIIHLKDCLIKCNEDAKWLFVDFKKPQGQCNCFEDSKAKGMYSESTGADVVCYQKKGFVYI